jgi:hypothetical protein
MRLKEDNNHYNSPYYPYFFVVPQDVIQKFGFMEYKFTFIVSDIIQRDLENQNDVLSDTLQIMDDILGQFRLSVTESLGNFNELFYLDTPITCIPFLEKYDDLLGGWTADVTIQVMIPLDRCDAAFNSWLTPTPTVTPSSTPTNTPTPTNTQTPTTTSTSTPTPTRTRFGFAVFTGSSFEEACSQINIPTTIYGDSNIFTENSQFYNDFIGPVTIDMSGIYNYEQTVVQLSSTGNAGVFGICSSPTPTPTVTPSSTPTNTPTMTSTPTPTPTKASGNKLWNTNTTNWNDETGLWNTI